MQPEPPSHGLVALARSGDAAAVRAIIDAHVAAMYRVAFRLTKDHHAAEDIVQDVLIRLLDAETELSTTDATRRWLLRVTRNLAITHIRRASAGERAVQRRAQLIDLTTESPARQIEQRVLAAAVLTDLTERERELLVRHHVHGEALAVLAEERATSAAVVKVQISRARAKARATGRRRDIDGIPWWIPAPLARLTAAAKGATGTVASKAAIAALIPALVIGGSLVGPLAPNLDSDAEGGQASLSSRGWDLEALVAANAIQAQESGFQESAPAVPTASTSAGDHAHSGSNVAASPSRPKDAITGQIEYPLSGRRVEVVEGGPGYSAEPAGPIPEGTQYLVYADVLTEHGFYQGTVYQPDDAPQVVPTLCVVAEQVPDEVAYCAVAGSDGGEVESGG